MLARRIFSMMVGFSLLLTGLILSDGSNAQAAPARGPFGRTIPLADVLAADGTLQIPAGEYGTLDLTGYRPENAQGGAPHFAPATSPAMGNWASGFDVAGMNSTVYALAFDSSGNLYVGGDFTMAGTCPSGCNYIAKWDGTTWSALDTGMNNSVRALAFDSSGNLYAGGPFTMAGTCVGDCKRIAKWDGTNWSALSTGMNSSVNALAFDSSGNLYAGGSFTTAGTCVSGCNRIAKWDGTTWSALDTGMNDVVYALAVDSSDNLYAGGYFTTAGTCASGCEYIAKWDGTTWSALDTGMDYLVFALAVDSGDNLYAGGQFTTAGMCASGCNSIAKWDGTNWSALSTGIDSPVYALAFDSSGNLYAGGSFSTAGTCVSGCNDIAKWDGTIWSALETGINDPVNALAFDSSDNLYAGGDFTTAGACVSGCNHIAKWDGATWSSVGVSGNGTNDPVSALAVDSSGNLYAGGDFTTAGTCVSGCNYIAKWDGTTWSALDTGVNDSVLALAFDSSDNLYAGGYLTSAGTCASADGCKRIAKWDGTTWSALSTGMSNRVLALAVDSSGILYAGGLFTAAGTCASNCKYIARWDGTTWRALRTGMDNVVSALAVDSSGNLYAGGTFTTAGPCTSDCNSIAKWDGTNWSALDTGMNREARALAVDSTDNLYAGGHFSTAGGIASNYIAEWIPQVASANFAVTKVFSDNSPQRVTFHLECSTGSVDTNDLLADKDNPAVFTVTDYDPGATCTATEPTVPSGYTADESSCVDVDLEGGGACTITNTAKTTAVDVTGLRGGVNAKGKVVVRWRTPSESQIAGFNVYRKAAHGIWRMANRKFKQAQHAGDAAGARYRWADKHVRAGQTYRYKLEVIYLDGHSEWTKAIRVKPE